MFRPLQFMVQCQKRCAVKEYLDSVFDASLGGKAVVLPTKVEYLQSYIPLLVLVKQQRLVCTTQCSCIQNMESLSTVMVVLLCQSQNTM